MREASNSSLHRWITDYAPLLVWVAVVLFLSSPQGSMTQTSRFIGPLLEFLFPTASADQLLAVHGLVRKCAHFAEYAVLGFLGFRAISKLDSRSTPSKWFWASVVLVSIIAVVDEVNQSFEPSRTGSPWDVSIDLAGGVFAALVCYVWARKRAT